MSSHLTATCSILVLVSALLLLPVSAGADTITADFTAHDSFTHGFAPFTASFEDRSIMAASWLWNFGDGQTSTESNPAHTYAYPGSYTVTLTIHDTTGTLTNTKTMADYIVVAQDPMYPVTTTAVVTSSTTTPHSTTATTSPTPTGTPALAGAVEVTSEPTGAMVLLNGAEQGITPITIYGVPIGKHTIKVHSKGYVDNETSVTVEYQKTVPLKIVLGAVGAKPGVSPTMIPATTTIPVTTETTTQEGQKAARVVPATMPPGGNGVIHIQCIGCKNLESSHWIWYGVRFEGAERWKVNTSTQSEEITTDISPGEYIVRIEMDQYKSQQQSAVVRQGKTTDVKFQGNTFVKTPGFTIFLAVLAIAGLIAIRRFRN